MTLTKTEDRTAEVLQAMLTENTGQAMLDSGGAYGRNWERNQGIDWDSIPAATLQFRQWRPEEAPEEFEIESSLNVYHWLKDRVTFLPELQAEFEAFCELPENEDSHWLQLAQGFAASKNGMGIYRDGEPMTINTYNGEDMLSQIIQYVYWEDEDRNCYALIQIHGGCDARGGYTAPKVFSVSNEEYCLLDNARATIICSGPEPDTEPTLPGMPEQVIRIRHYWDTENGGYTWTNESGEDYPDLKDFTASDFKIDPETHEGRCPICGGKLGLYAY